MLSAISSPVTHSPPLCDRGFITDGAGISVSCVLGNGEGSSMLASSVEPNICAEIATGRAIAINLRIDFKIAIFQNFTR
jgi:hypothetical protein